MKNPFKFTKERPEYKVLWEELVNMLPDDTESVRALFEYLRVGEWSSKRLEISHKDEVERIIKSTMLEPITEDMKKYITHIELFKNVLSSKLAFHLCTLKVREVENILGRDDTKDQILKLKNVDSLLNTLYNNIYYDPGEDTIIVESKEELRDKVIRIIITGEKVKSFELRKESSATPDGTEDTDGRIHWETNGEMPKGLDDNTKVFIRTEGGTSSSESRNAAAWDWSKGPAKMTAYKIDTAKED